MPNTFYLGILGMFCNIQGAKLFGFKFIYLCHLDKKLNIKTIVINELLQVQLAGCTLRVLHQIWCAYVSPSSENLKSLRVQRGLPQAVFGRFIGLLRSNVSAIEQGARYAPDISVLRPLIAALNLNAAEQETLLICSRESPRKLNIPPDAPAAAFRFIAELAACWPDISTTEFESMQLELQRLHRPFLDGRQPPKTKEARSIEGY